jgi:polar amino acid transport system substrate-binding protein
MIALVIGVTGAALLVSWYASRDRSLERLEDEGIIRIGYAVEAPYAFLQPDGEVTGESPEVAKVVVRRLGIGRIVWHQTEFGSLIGGLEAGEFDVIAAGMFVTPERAGRVLFSHPTFHVHQALLVGRGNPRDVHSYEQVLRLPDTRVAVIAGAIEEALLRRMGAQERHLVVVPDALAGRVAVESGMADGLALSSPTIRWMALRSELHATESAEPFTQPDNGAGNPNGVGAFAFRPGEKKLCKAWNAALAGYIGTSEHLESVARFGFTRAELPELTPPSPTVPSP